MTNFDDELRPDAEASRVICDEELINIEIKELNKKIKEQCVSKELAIRLKQRRRTLKNRNYATSCREKKDAEISSLEVERNKELEELRELEQGNQSIRDKMDDMARQYNRILEFAQKHNLDVRSEDLEYSITPEERISD